MKTETLLIIGGVAVIAYILYTRQQNAALGVPGGNYTGAPAGVAGVGSQAPAQSAQGGTGDWLHGVEQGALGSISGFLGGSSIGAGVSNQGVSGSINTPAGDVGGSGDFSDM